MLLLLALSGAPVDLSAQIKQQVARQECRTGRGSGDEVVVCSNRRDRNRYRLTQSNSPRDLERERPNSVRERAKWIEEGDTGTNSCSPVGPGGHTGCMQKRWKKLRQQKKGWYGL
jgi:hypothetical protein